MRSPVAVLVATLALAGSSGRVLGLQLQNPWLAAHKGSLITDAERKAIAAKADARVKWGGR